MGDTVVGAAQRALDGGAGARDGPMLRLLSGRRQGALGSKGNAEPDDDADTSGITCKRSEMIEFGARRDLHPAIDGREALRPDRRDAGLLSRGCRKG